MQKVTQQDFDLQVSSLPFLDAIIFLGGEDDGRSRSRHLLKLLIESNKLSPEQPYIILTGSKPVSYNYVSYQSECQATNGYLRIWGSFSKGINFNKIISEERGKDTYGNIYYAKETLDSLLSNQEIKKVGLLTNPFHMSRSLWAAKKILKDYTIMPLPTQKQFNYKKRKLKELPFQLSFCLAHLAYTPKEFMDLKHPLYSENKEFSSKLLQKFF
jgi:hypothetical protein